MPIYEPRLLAGAPIQMVNTDPPYNVKVEQRTNNAVAAGLSSFPAAGDATGQKLRARDRPISNDAVSDREFERLLSAWFGNIARVLQPGRAFYIWAALPTAATTPLP